MSKALIFVVVLIASVASAQISLQSLSPQQKEVWEREQNHFRYLQARDLKSYMALWDDNFVGWPDYMDHPARKSDIEASVRQEFASSQKATQLILPEPIVVEVFDDIAITIYFWPDADRTNPRKYRIIHTWKKGPSGWRIIGGMS